ncbi:Hypothetical predicted protein, partial [Paramuricea clavata]
KRKDLDVSKCKRHEKSVGDVMATICSMTNLFNADQAELVGLSSGVEVESKVADNILQAKQLGEHQFSEFCQNNLFCDKPDLFTKIKQNKLKTFSSKHLTLVSNVLPCVVARNCQNGQKENTEDTDEEDILGSDSSDIDQDSEDDDDVFEE